MHTKFHGGAHVPSPPVPSSPKKPKRTPVPVLVPMASAAFYLLFLNLIPGCRLSDGAPIRVAG